MRAIRNLIKYLILIKWRAQIAPLPRMAASEYKHVTPDEALLMTRYGIRSPSGVKAAMRKHKVQTVEQLIEKLEHFRPRRNIWQRLTMGFRRIAGGTPYNPHTVEIRQINPTRENEKLLQERIKRLKDAG